MNNPIDVGRAARILDCPTGFYHMLAHRGLVPPVEHGMVDARRLRIARLRHRWLNMLSDRLTRDEAARISTGLTLPPDHLTDLPDGETAAPLWRILEYSWGSGRMNEA